MKSTGQGLWEARRIDDGMMSYKWRRIAVSIACGGNGCWHVEHKAMEEKVKKNWGQTSQFKLSAQARATVPAFANLQRRINVARRSRSN